ncbi:hypothetical protein COV93_07385 [Candidatus Woesearchaeota archaeon CG11_big_fil_rev_8_21_14_0_20_43_8]|nr:MAG: hypothetical protein COV93_07385 [Candidatus Woesearchaeota archaeon CG11_big_fil_rev_8_21_14_0_20_43_8]PIO04531.1 MAG: hypothetical protein COT47_08580 [Candidatus Woesearchaeota archaeon CG08_land_8_20_14_0_20_43_7]
MDARYKNRFRYHRLHQLFLKAENIPILEDILSTEGARLQRLRDQKHSDLLRFGKIPKEEELIDILRLVKKRVDAMLDLNQVRPCKIRYWNLLDLTNNPISIGKKHQELSSVAWYSSNMITIKPTALEHLVPIIAHEYTHHIQYEIFGDIHGESWKAFKEGHARALVRHFSNAIARDECSEEYCYKMQNRTVNTLLEAYRHLCSTNGHTASRALLSIPTEKQIIPLLGRTIDKAIGLGLFLIIEQDKGQEMYRDMLQGTFEFPKWM